MSKIAGIALNTFKEAVRNKVLYFLLIFALLILGFSGIMSDLSIAEPEKLIKDLGLASIDLFGFLIAVFVGVYLVYNELDKKTIYTIVSKPIDRYQFILGKFFGLLFTIYVNIAIMALFFFAVLYFREATDDGKLMKLLYPEVGPNQTKAIDNLQFHYYMFYVKGFFVSIGKAFATFFGYAEPITAGLLRVVLMSGLGLSILTGFAIFYSTFSTPTLSAVFTFMTFIIGSLNEDILRYADRLAQKAGGDPAGLLGADKLKYWFAWVSMHIAPNLALFDKRLEAIYGRGELDAAPLVPVMVDWVSVVYGLTYVAGVLCVACMIFNRRNFK